MPETEQPLPLETYAFVMAGLNAGLPLARVLAHAELTSARWLEGSELWQEAIDRSAAEDLQVLVSVDAALLKARQKFEPRVEPIQSDPAAWAAFRRHFVTALDPSAFLQERGLTLSLYARLEAEWADRTLQDEALAKQVQAQMDVPLGPCPALSLTPSPLVAPPAPAVGVEEPAPAEPAGIALERYAVMLADSTVFGLDDARICDKHGIPLATKQEAFAFWSAAVAKDPALDARVAQVIDRYRKAMQQRRPSSSPSFAQVVESAPASVAPAALGPYMAVPLAPPAPALNRQNITGPISSGAIARARATLPFATPESAPPPPLEPSVPPPTLQQPPQLDDATHSPAQTMVSAVDAGMLGPALPFQTAPVEGVTFETYVRVAAEISVLPMRKDAVFAKHGLKDEAHFKRIARGFEKQGGPSLLVEYARLFSLFRDEAVAEAAR